MHPNGPSQACCTFLVAAQVLAMEGWTTGKSPERGLEQNASWQGHGWQDPEEASEDTKSKLLASALAKIATWTYMPWSWDDQSWTGWTDWSGFGDRASGNATWASGYDDWASGHEDVDEKEDVYEEEDCPGFLFLTRLPRSGASMHFPNHRLLSFKRGNYRLMNMCTGQVDIGHWDGSSDVGSQELEEEQ